MADSSFPELAGAAGGGVVSLVLTTIAGIGDPIAISAVSTLAGSIGTAGGRSLAAWWGYRQELNKIERQIALAGRRRELAAAERGELLPALPGPE